MLKNSVILHCSYLIIILLRVVRTEVISAINCGGPAHIDSHGTEFEADSLSIGTSSDYGRSFVIARVPEDDQIIYQTERYHTGDFSYTLSFQGDGNYVLSLLFSEVWFTEPNQKVFHVQLEKSVNILEYFDIFNEAGFATGLDRHITINIRDGILHTSDGSATLSGNSFTVDFIEIGRDNPKINGIILTKGPIDDVPKLPAMNEQRQAGPPPTTREPEEQQEASADSPRRKRPAGSPRAPDPYETTDSTYWLLPFSVAIAVLLPILFCLCRV